MALREDEVEVDDELFEGLVIGQDLSEQLLLEGVEEAQRVFRYADLLSSGEELNESEICLLYTSPSPRDRQKSRMPSSA